MGELPARVQERLNQLSEKFKSELPDRLEEIEVLFSSAESGNLPALREMRNKVHRLAGTAATFGFESISSSAKFLENHIEREIALNKTYAGTEIKEALSALTSTWNAPVPIDEVSRMEHGRAVFLLADLSQFPDSFNEQMSVFGYIVEKIETLEEIQEGFASLNRQTRIENGVAIIDQNYFLEDKSRLKVLNEIRNQYKDRLLFVLVARDSNFDARLRSVRYGADAFFESPVEITQLIEKLEELFGEEEAEPYHILIVDDDPEQVSETALVLQEAGMITSVVSEADHLWQVLVEYKPELILMDMYMPRCSGMELATIIRQNDSFVSVPIVFLSVEQDEKVQLSAIKAGGDDFLVKPIDPEHLVGSVRNRAARNRAMRFYMERDSLTGLLNHTNLKNRLSHELERATRIGTELSFVMLDIDHFKKVNDTYGHLTGDRVLKNLSRLLQDRLRRTDVIGRYGGEEFAIILFNTDSQRAFRIVDEIRENFSRFHQSSGEAEFTVSLSAGIAEYPAYETAAELGEAADTALYEAKNSGRNRVIIAKQ